MTSIFSSMMNTCRRAILSLALVLLSVPAWAQTVTDVVYDSGNGIPPPRPLLDATVKTRKGDTFSRPQVDEDLKALMKSGSFSDATVTVEADGVDGVRVTFSLNPVAIISSVTVDSVLLIPEKWVTKKITMKEGMVADVFKIANDVDAIRNFYNGKGFYNTEVSYELSDIDIATRSVGLTFIIRERPRYKLRKVEFTGNTHFADNELEEQILSKATWWSHIFNTGYMDPGKLDIDRGIIKNLYLGAGFLDCEIPRIEDNHYDRKHRWVTVKFRIDEGVRYTLSTVGVRGNVRFAASELPEPLCKPGGWYNEEAINADIDALEQLYGRHGYADIRIDADRQVDTARKQVALTYRISEGAVSRVNDIIISGNKRTQDRVIRRELSLHPGDLVDKWSMDLDSDRLMNMNYFEEVDFTPVSTGTDGIKDLQLRVKEKYTGQFMVGGAFSLDDSASGYVEWSQSNFDLFGMKNRFTGGGQRLRLRAQVGELASSFLVSFTEPWLFNQRLSLQTDFYQDNRFEDTYKQQVQGMDISLTRPFIGAWRQRVGFGVHLFSIDSDTGASPEILRQAGDDFSNSVNFTLFRNTRHPSIMPHEGSLISAGLTYSSKAFGSYEEWLRADTRFTYYVPVSDYLNFSHLATLKLNAEVSGILLTSGAYNENNDLKIRIFDRLFAGGGSDIRGFKRREIGPLDDRDEALGGGARMVLNAEYLYHVNRSFAIAVFVDAGNVWNRIEDIDGDLNVSYGFGLQVKTPAFPIRLDYGIPLRTTWDHLDGSNGEFHFSMSTSF